MTKTHQHAAIIVAGGTGTRMGSSTPKQFLLLNGKPILIHTIECFWRFDKEMPIVVVMHPSFFTDWLAIVDDFLEEVQRKKLFICEGGKERVDSVHNGMKRLQLALPHSQHCKVAIHDAVRPFLSQKLLTQTFEAAMLYEAAIPCVPIKASLRRINPQTQENQPVPRAEYLEVQTPQILDFATFLDCLEKRSHDNFTDDASLFQEMTGTAIHIVAGDYNNIKITTPDDLWLGEKILQSFQ